MVPSNAASTSARFIDPDRWTRERAAVGDQHARLAPRPPDPSADWRDRIQQRLELGDVMTVAAGQEHGQRDAGRVGQDVVLAARPGPVNRAWSDRVLPFGPNVGGVDRRAGPVDLIARSQADLAILIWPLSL